jgi:hypothetical protein
MDGRMTRVIVALACAAGIQPAFTAEGSASADVARCAGRVPTIVSDAHTVEGTPGDDVIVVRGRVVTVEAGAGDDAICVRGHDGYTYVDAGRGDDDVRVETKTLTVVSLDTGDDTFRGGRGTDYVASGERGRRNRDRIDLGAGDDIAILRGGRDHRQAVVLGGSGEDEITFSVRRSGAVHVDAATRRATVGGSAYATWDGFERFRVGYAIGRQEFTGTQGDDHVVFSGSGAVSATTLGGDDTVSVHVTGSETSSAAVHLDLGDGTDLLDVDSEETRVVGDLTVQRVDLFSHDPSGVEELVGSFGFAGVEGLAVSVWGGSLPTDEPSSVTLVGDDRANVLEADACQVELRGGAGSDHLLVGNHAGPESVNAFTAAPAVSCRRTSDVHGEAGDDVMISHLWHYDTREAEDGDPVRATEVPVRDHLDGGDGVDTARAGRGVDTCLAETRVDCEA